VNDYVLSVILGIVEGLTEFIPVSSTAHLRLAEALLHIDLSSGYWKMYSIVIQLGAILTLPIYFRERIANFLAHDLDPPAQPGPGGLRSDGHPFVSAGKSNRKAPGEPIRDRIVASDWRYRDVVRRHKERESGGRGRSINGWADPHLAHGGNELGTGYLDRRLPDFVGSVSGDLAFDVHDRGGPTRGNVTGLGT